MGKNNVFHKDVNYLISAKNTLVELQSLKDNREELQDKIKKTKKSISAEERSISDEIFSTVKVRKDEISSTYDKELDKNREKIKEIRAKRDKKKLKKLNERVKVETTDISEENDQLIIQMKTMFKKEHVPSICNYKMYYALFLPKGIKEISILFAFVILTLFILPLIVCGIASCTFLASIENKFFYYAVIYFIVVVIVVAIYYIILNKTKVKYRDILKEGRQIRDKIKANEKKIQAIHNTIKKDKDESSYNLEDYDRKIKGLEDEGTQIANDKQEALKVFENSAKPVIIEEINERRLPSIQKLKQELKELEETFSKVEKQIKEVTLMVSNQFESYLGKEFTKQEVLDILIQIMQSKEAGTISEAISIYREQMQGKR